MHATRTARLQVRASATVVSCLGRQRAGGRKGERESPAKTTPLGRAPAAAARAIERTHANNTHARTRPTNHQHHNNNTTVANNFKQQSKPQAAPSAAKSQNTCRVAVLGASGYTGAEVVRLAALHPNVEIVALTGEKQAGKAFAEVFPHLGAGTDASLVKIADVDFSSVDAAFCCLPHATTQAILKALPTHVKVVDLSADFRLADVDVYAEW